MTRRALEAEVPYVSGLIIGMLLAAPAFVGGYFDRYDHVTSNNDFASFWVGARAMLDGHDPYRTTDWPALAKALGGWADTSAFGYPAWVAILFLPLAALPLPLAAAVWTVGGLVAAIVAVRWLLWTRFPAMPLVHTLVGMTLIASQPSRIALYWGQWAFVLTAALIAAVALQPRRPGAAGATAAVLLAKPHLFLLTVPALIVRATGLGAAARWVGGFATALAAAVVVSLLWLPGWLGAWLAVGATERNCNVCLPGNVLGALIGADPRATPTTAAVAGALGTPGGVAVAVGLIALAVAVAMLYPPRTDAGVGVWIALSLCVAPYAWSHDHLLLLPAAVLVAGDVARRGAPRRAALVVAATCGILVVVASLFRALDHAAADRQILQSLVPGLMLLLLVATALPARTHAAARLAARGQAA